MGKPEAAPIATSPAGIRRRAAACTVAMAAFVAGIGAWDGRPWADVATAGLGAGAAGLASWTTYHLVSRRNDGLALFNIAIVFARERPRTGWPDALMITAVGILLGFAFGWTGRAKPSEVGGVGSRGPG